MSYRSIAAATSSMNAMVSCVGAWVTMWSVAPREWLPGAASNVSDATTTLPASPSLWISSTANGMREVVASTRTGGVAISGS